MTFIRSPSRGVEPQTQQDIVDEKFPPMDLKYVTFKNDKLPALKDGFSDQDQFARFAQNTLRMRRVQSWQFTLVDPDTSRLRWERVSNAQQAQRLNIEAKAFRLAEILFSQPNCAGVRVSTDRGIEVAVATGEDSPQDLTLVLSYKPQ